MLSDEEDLGNVASDDEGEEGLVPSIETPCPLPCSQPAISDPPRIEFFNPTNQTWSANGTEMPSVNPFKGSFAFEAADILSSNIQPSGEEAGSAVVMEDRDLDVFMEDFVDLTQCGIDK